MKRPLRLLPLFLLFFLANASAQQERHARVRVDLGGRHIRELAQLGLEVDHGLHWPGRFWESEISVSELDAIQKAGFKTEVVIADVAAYFVENQQNEGVASRTERCSLWPFDYPTPKGYKYGTMGGYLTYQQMLNFIDTLAKNYPGLISKRKMVSDTIRSIQGRPIWYVKMSDNPEQDENEPEVLYTALHHAREPNSLSQMLFFMLHLLENYDKDPEVRYILHEAEIYFVPCINPDGYIFNETTNPSGGGTWRKNRRLNADGTYGVDLNRNYGYFWGNDNIGSSANPGDGTYRGSAPFSEPETRMMRDFCRQHDFKFVQNNHTSGNLLIYPWAYADKPADTAFIRYAEFFAEENRYKTGVSTQTVGYQVNGSSDDWMHAETGTFSFTPETGLTGFWPLPTEIDNLNKSMLTLNMRTALSALVYGLIMDTGPAEISYREFDLNLDFQRFGLADGPFNIVVAPFSSNIEKVSTPISVNLKVFEAKRLKYSVKLADDVQIGDPVVFLVETDNGGYYKTDTLRKFFGGAKKTVFSDQVPDNKKWVGNWGTSNKEFVSPPLSITDSPNGNYIPNAWTFIRMAQPVQIPLTARQPYLTFWAKWELERNADYVALSLQEEFGGKEHFLCGRYSKKGNDRQILGEPVYDNVQPTWVQERIDLSPYKGIPFRLMFQLGSDSGVERDGFYFDDLRIEYIDPNILDARAPDGSPLAQLHCTPSFGSDKAILSWNNLEKPDRNLQIFNALGQVVFQQHLPQENGQLDLFTAHWPKGLYRCVVGSAEGLISTNFVRME